MTTTPEAIMRAALEPVAALAKLEGLYLNDADGGMGDEPNGFMCQVCGKEYDDAGFCTDLGDPDAARAGCYAAVARETLRLTSPGAVPAPAGGGDGLLVTPSVPAAVPLSAAGQGESWPPHWSVVCDLVPKVVHVRDDGHKCEKPRRRHPDAR